MLTKTKKKNKQQNETNEKPTIWQAQKNMFADSKSLFLPGCGFLLLRLCRELWNLRLDMDDGQQMVLSS